MTYTYSIKNHVNLQRAFVFSTVSFYKRANHEPSRTTFAPSSLVRVGKILIYVKTDYHKLVFVFVQVWDPSAVNKADFIRIRVGHGLTPTKATLLLGIVQQFSSSVISEGIYTTR